MPYLEQDVEKVRPWLFQLRFGLRSSVQISQIAFYNVGAPLASITALLAVWSRVLSINAKKVSQFFNTTMDCRGTRP
jgi:hypothetical protein